MSEAQENSMLSSKSLDNVDSLKQDANGEQVMSKSKARSLRRKRAKQRKKALENQAENKAQSHDKENNDTSLTKESQATKKKKRPKKKKNKAKIVEQPKLDLVNNDSMVPPNSAAAPNVIPGATQNMDKLSKNDNEKPNPTATPNDFPNAKPSFENLSNGQVTPKSATAPKTIPIAETEVEKQHSERLGNSSTIVKRELVSISKQLDDSVENPVERTREAACESNAAPTAFYEDDNESNKNTKEDCDCACIIS